jgi:hypothetical protein
MFIHELRRLWRGKRDPLGRILVLLDWRGRRVWRVSVSLVQCCAEGGGFALETVAPVREAEAETEVGEHGCEVVECGDGAGCWV